MSNIYNPIDKSLDFIYGEALGDATRRTGFENLDDFKNNNVGRDTVKKYLKEIISDGKPDPMKYIIEVVNDSEKYNFGFGRSQKLINMAAKYLYVGMVFAENDEEKQIKVRDKFKKCHCPMDRRMIKKVLKELKKTDKYNEFWEDERHKNGNSRALTTDTAWSVLTTAEADVKAYNTFQDIVNELKSADLSLLEFDLMHWN